MLTHGVVATGHKLSAQAGATMLQMGGNAFDAACAAAFAGSVCEPTLTGLGGGGFATIHHAKTGVNQVLDFFVSYPGHNKKTQVASMQEIEVLYGVAPQIYNIGPATCAVPGFVKGVLLMQSNFGTLTREQVLSPAISLAKNGFIIDAQVAYNLSFLENILLNTDRGKEIFAPEGKLLGEGDKLVQPLLAKTLEIIAKEGEEAFYQGKLAQKIIEWSEQSGGLITKEDLFLYQNQIHKPLAAQFYDHEILLPPPPSSGGVLSLFALSLWKDLAKHPLDSPEGLDLFLRVLRRTNQLRGREFDQLLYTGKLAERVLEDTVLMRASRQIKEQKPSSPFTTQISVLDEYNNAVSMTCSTGVGSGEFVLDTGFQLSNMLGESDLFPTDYKLKPRERLTSMMSPGLVMCDATPVIATGSAGSTRIRSAIFQTILRFLESSDIKDLDERVNLAVQASRAHLEGDIVHLEAGVSSDYADYLTSQGFMVQVWPQKHLYFGGVNMAVRENGTFAGAGDSRRGGAAVVI